MSSLRNAVKRTTHKERSQPSARKRLGLLEKHKDFVERAKNFHKKEDAIRLLRQKASFRNPDEFYFRMQRQETKGGVHQAKVSGHNPFSHEQILLMKTQDLAYLQSKAQIERKKIEKLSSVLHFTQEGEYERAGDMGRKRRRHWVFGEEGDEGEEQEQRDEGSGKQREGKGVEVKVPNALLSKLKRKVSHLYSELAQREQRLSQLMQVEEEVRMQRAAMGKGSKKRIKPSPEERKDEGEIGRGGEKGGEKSNRLRLVWKKERKQ